MLLSDIRLKKQRFSAKHVWRISVACKRKTVRVNGMDNEPESNGYSSAWFQLFHLGIPASRTEQETAFIVQCCPLPAYQCILDLCCGMGRHSRALAAQGYEVTGVERDTQAIATARDQAGGPTYVQADVRDYQPDTSAFDAVVIMSQSFGYFDPDTNASLLGKLARALRPDGRLLLDLWNPAFFLLRQGQRTFELPGGSVRETTRLDQGRLFSRLDYPGGGHDAFEFQTFSVEEMAHFAEPLGLGLVTACTNFEAGNPSSESNPRIQFVLARC